jgi:uncharacterized protein YuzE
MKLTIDREADALYLDLDESLSFESQEIAPGVILDYSKEGKVVGIEMLYLSKRFDISQLKKLEVEPRELVGGECKDSSVKVRTRHWTAALATDGA